VVGVAGVAGAVLMVLYYFPSLSFPYPSEHTLIVDDHIIYAIALVALAVLKAGRVWGVAGWLQAQSIVARHSHWLKKID
jgi:thiosulfate dehydrogenase [quinone] large subunit